MSMYWKAENGEINCATWALNADADIDCYDEETYQDDPAADSGNEKRDDDTDETVVNREKTVRAIRWMESTYPDQLSLIQQQVSTGWIQSNELSSGQVLTEEVTKKEQECWDLVRRDVDELNRRAWQMQQQQQQQQAQQYASYQHQHQYPNHYQTQYHTDQYQLETTPGYHPYQTTHPSSSSGYYLPLPLPLPPSNTTLYLTAPGGYDGHDGYTEDADISGVAGLLTAPLSADEAPRSKSGSSSSKNASKYGKTERRREKGKENKGKGGGKNKGQR
ncbi:hypothetical protein QR685DRAFT_578586 [Neurospora intermedia]|uniref:Uncharacterized protein n=1 Tax=Neurospora intermedia TaxID=5142 RepID=A0ABR3DSQ7_NEUIN